MRVLALVVIGCLVSVSVGCGPSGPKKYPVSGNIKFGEIPLAQGHIVFTPADGAGAPDAGPIVAGKYSFDASPGKKKVEITATREKGGVDPSMGQAPREQYIGPQFNVETKLEAEVTPGGPNQFDFTVTEK